MNDAPLAQAAQFLWIGGPLSRLEQLCLRSFVNHGYAVHLYAYEDVSPVPAGVVLRPAADILPRSAVFQYSIGGYGLGSYAGFADLFRYHLLRDRGGWWFDTDFVSVRRLPAPSDVRFASSFEGAWGACANCCAMFSPRPGHPVFADLAGRAAARVARGAIQWGDIGPQFLVDYVKERSLGSQVAPWWEFSPYPWRLIPSRLFTTHAGWARDRLRQARHLVWQLSRRDFQAAYLRPGTRAIHLHNEIWRANGLDKTRRYHPLSFYERLHRLHPAP